MHTRDIVLAAVLVMGVLVAPSALANASDQPSAQDVNYLQTSISGDRFEIIGGKLALRRGGTARIRALGARLIKDHSKSLAEATAEAKKVGIKVPNSPTPSMVWELHTVAAMSGAAFDRAYTSLEVKDHQQDIEETTFEAQHGSDASIKADAKKELPMLRMHLRLSIAANHSA